MAIVCATSIHSQTNSLLIFPLLLLLLYKRWEESQYTHLWTFVTRNLILSYKMWFNVVSSLLLTPSSSNIYINYNRERERAWISRRWTVCEYCDNISKYKLNKQWNRADASRFVLFSFQLKSINTSHYRFTILTTIQSSMVRLDPWSSLCCTAIKYRHPQCLDCANKMTRYIYINNQLSEK